MDLGIDGYEDAVEIGRGGFGAVYRARQPKFNRTVAIKVLPEFGNDDAARQRFDRECAALGTLSGHPQIVTVYDSGLTSEGRPYMTMAYLPRGSMADKLRRAALRWTDAVEATVKVAGALEAAHQVGIVHRDIKPENILVSDYGEPQLADFGIARISGGHETRSGVITASLVHAAPEVISGQRPSPASDLYSLASTLYELLTGAPAFALDTDETVAPMIARISSAPVPDLRPLGVPEDVRRAIERAMAKDPSERQASVEEFGQELREAQRRAGVQVTSMTVAGGASEATVVVRPRPTPPVTPKRRQGALFVVAGGVALALVVLVAALATRGGPVAPDATSSTEATGAPTTRVAEGPPVTAPASAPSGADIATAVLEPDSFGGQPLGASEEAVISAFGDPDTSTVQQNSAGPYTRMVWTRKTGEGFVAITIDFRSGSSFSPGLTNWLVAGPGPRTAKGIQIGDDESKAVAAHGPADFSVIQIDGSAGRLMISINEGKVAAFLGGDPVALAQT